MALLFVTGCVLTPQKEEQSTFQITESQSDRYAYGHGFGQSREAALRAARDELAEMILVNVRTETRQDLRATAEQEVTREFASSSFSWSNVSLENTRVDFEQRLQVNTATEYYVRLRIDRPTLERLTQLAREKAPALNAVYQIEKLPLTQPAQRLAGVIQGDNIASRDKVFKHDFLTSHGSSATFETYFKEVTEASVRALTAIPILQAGSKGRSKDHSQEIAFVLLHTETATPQRNAQLYVRSTRGPNAGKEYELTTNSQGTTRYLSRAELGEQFTVSMKVAERVVSGSAMEQFREIARYSYANITQANETTVFFYLNPGEANLRINNESLGAPVRHSLKPGASYQLQVRAERYRERSDQLVIPSGAAYAFYAVELEARQYGHLNLAVRGRGNTLQVRRDLQEWQLAHGGTFEQEYAEAGSYVARVGRAQGQSFDENYQIIQDLFELEHEQTYSRVYPAPLYREPYKHGWGVSLYMLRGGGEPTAAYRVPYLYSSSDGAGMTGTGHYGQFKRDAGQYDNFHLGSAEDFLLNVQRYFDTFNFTVQGSAGIRKHTFYRPSNASGFSHEDLELNSLTGSVGAGFWHSFYSGMVLASVTVNQAYEYAKWNHDSDVYLQLPNNEWALLPSTGGKANRYLFGEANALFSLGEGFGFSVSVSVPFETRQPLIQLGVSYSFFESGYRKPAIINYTP